MTEPTLFQKSIDPKEHVRKHADNHELIGEISKKVNNIAANQRVLEERYSSLRGKNQLSEKNIIDIEKEVNEDTKSLSDDIIELKHDINDLKDKLGLISKEVKNLVNKNDFGVLEKYLDMWQPMNFVTHNELKRIIEEEKNKKKTH